jgi:hypothetical protein
MEDLIQQRESFSDRAVELAVEMLKVIPAHEVGYRAAPEVIGFGPAVFEFASSDLSPASQAQKSI